MTSNVIRCKIISSPYDNKILYERYIKIDEDQWLWLSLNNISCEEESRFGNYRQGMFLVMAADIFEEMDSKERVNVLVIEIFERSRSKKLELLAKVYDHAKRCYHFGFRMLTLGLCTFSPVSSILLSSEDKKNFISEAAPMDGRSVGSKHRVLSVIKGTEEMLSLLRVAKTAKFPAKYVLFDSWFTSPKTVHAIKKIGDDVIGMVKKAPKMHFRYNGEDIFHGHILSEEEIIHIYEKWWI